MGPDAQPTTRTRRIWPILAVALVLRLGIFALIAISTSQLEDPIQSRAFNGGDSDEYILLARNIVEHGVFSQDTSAPFAPDIRRTPGCMRRRASSTTRC